MDTNFPPYVLYIIENKSEKKFYASCIPLEYSIDENKKFIINSNKNVNTNKYVEMKHVFHRNETKWGINKFYRKLYNKSKHDNDLKMFINSNVLYNISITGFLFNCKRYPSLHMDGFGLDDINNITIDEIHKIVFNIKNMYKKGYMGYTTQEVERDAILYERKFKKKFIVSKWEYILRDEPYTYINKRNSGKTQQQKNKSRYDKKKSDTQFVYNKNRKQCLINIKKTNKRPSQKSIDKYKLTESEIQKHLVN